MFDPKIFKAYDIRGEWNKDWDGEGVYKIGQAISQVLKTKKVAIGFDARNSSKEIFENLAKAFNDSGIDVLNLGLSATELVYFASSHIDNLDLAIMITGSHNKPEDNGLKITLKDAKAVGLDSGLKEIRDFSGSNKEIEEKGKTTSLDLWSEYKEHVFSLAKIKKIRLVDSTKNS